MTVIKRDRKDSAADLVTAIEKLNPLLEAQGEKDAVADLKMAGDSLRKSTVGTKQFQEAIDSVIDAFEGDHELMAYTLQRQNAGEWSEAEELVIASCRVLNLARRMKS
jgi:hypothetical protein